MLLYTTYLDILYQNFGVIDTRKYISLDDHFSQYDFLICKSLNALLTCPML